MTEEIRFGICGLGMGRHRAEVVTTTPGAKLVAVCDLLEDRGTEAAESLNCEWIRDYEDMLAHDDIDVVGILTPSGTHTDFARMALEAGKHAFVTKPMDISVAKCDVAIAAAEQSGLVLAVDFESRYSPINHQIRAAVQSGALGKIIAVDLMVRWYRSQQYYDGGSPPGWRKRLETDGGSLANQAVHYLDLIQWWLGPVKTAYGRSGTFVHDIETEDASVAMLEFDSGAFSVMFTSTSHFPDLGTTMNISGTRGTLSWKDQAITMLKAITEAEGQPDTAGRYTLPEHMPQPEACDISLDDFPVPDDLPANIIADMVRAVAEGKPVQCDGYEGRKTVQIFSAIYASSQTGQAEQLD